MESGFNLNDGEPILILTQFDSTVIICNKHTTELFQNNGRGRMNILPRPKLMLHLCPILKNIQAVV